MTLLLLVAFVLSATLGSHAQVSPRPTTVAPAGNADAGRKLFVSVGCYQCHGYEAQGSTATGPRLAPRPLPFPALSRYVRRPAGQMPPYTAKVLSDMELADIYAFLQSAPAPPATPALLK